MRASGGGGAPAAPPPPPARVKLPWKRLLRDAFGDDDAAELSVKRLRRRACAAAAQLYADAGADAPDSARLEAKCDAKLGASRHFVVAGKRVRLAAAAPECDAELEDGGELEADGGGEEADDAALRKSAARQRPSYIAWHTSPEPQRFGKFSAAEKSALDAAIAALAREEGLDASALDWLYHTRVGARQRAAWLQLARALPHRSPRQVWGHATRRLHAARGAGAWGEEETAALRRLVAQHGRDWVKIGEELDRLPDACRDRWRHVDKAYVTGRWSDAEAAQLKALVDEALATNAPPAPGTGLSFVVRDNLDWAAIASRLATARSPAACHQKYYADLAPSMTDAGTWGSGDDGRLLASLRDLGAAEASEVDWAAAAPPGRTGAAALRRWKLMCKHVPGGGVDRGFAGCVDFLVRKFADKLPQEGQ